MTFAQFIRVLGKNLKWLIIFPLLVAILVWFLTKRMPKQYESMTSIYTGIASGYGITTEESSPRIDYFAVNNAFDNLLVTIQSRQTIEDVAIRLLAQHLLLEMPDPMIVGQEGFERLKASVKEEDRAALIVPGNMVATIEKIRKVKNSSTDNIVVELLSSPKGYYSIQQILSNLSSERKAASDFLDIKYKSDDPGVCINTLIFIVDIFIDKYKKLKSSETDNVVKWFEARLREAAEELNNSENKFKDFGVRNKIINYYEQAKFIAEQNENNDTEYYKELMNYEGHKQQVIRLENQLESREILLRNNHELNKLRKELAAAHEEYERAKIYSNDFKKLDQLAKRVDDLKQETRIWVLQYYSLNNTIESVPSKTVLEKWLEESLATDAAEARLKIYIDRRKEFDRKYNEFSPLGMQMSRLEREISVAEKQYLEILHGLHLAKLRQQNIKMSNNLQVMDNPIFPTKALPSRRLLLIIISFVAAFFLLLVYFISRELLDSSIKNISRAEQLTGLKIFSALPDRVLAENNANLNKIENILLDYAVTNLKIELDNNIENVNNYLITLISSREFEGKTFAGMKLAEKLYALNYSVLFMSNDASIEDAETEDKRLRTLPYEVNSKLFSIKTEDNLFPELSRVRKENYNFIIVEIPAISVNAIPNQLLKNSKLTLMMLDARRVWSSSDNYVLNLFKKASNNSDQKIFAWLNFVTLENLENLVGEMPKPKKQKATAIKQNEEENNDEAETLSLPEEA
ncbi:MAG: GumC family protein [Bacteroidia bacterium]